MIDFRRITDDGTVVDYLASIISKQLSAGQNVLWMIAGGSAMDIAVKTAAKLKSSPNLPNLTVTLTDERYGPIGHPDSNWRQLIERGFSLPGAHQAPVLSDQNLAQTAANFKAFLNNALAGADYSVALAGMGSDGHIFGIKPGSPSVGDKQDVIGYEWDDYKRITPTINLIKRLDEVVVYAVGQEKHIQIDELDSNITVEEQPAQLLKQAKRVIFFNDYKGEAV